MQIWLTDSLTGIYLNPNTGQGGTPVVFRILYNDSTSITVDNAINYLTEVAIAGNTYIGEHYFDSLSVINNAKVETQDRVYYNNLDTTGGELQAENIYQVGMKKADVNGQWLLVSRQKTGIGNQVANGKGHGLVFRSWELVSGQGIGVRIQESKVRSQKSEGGRQKVEAIKQKSGRKLDEETVSSSQETAKADNMMLDTGSSKFETWNWKIETQNQTDDKRAQPVTRNTQPDEETVTTELSKEKYTDQKTAKATIEAGKYKTIVENG